MKKLLIAILAVGTLVQGGASLFAANRGYVPRNKALRRSVQTTHHVPHTQSRADYGNNAHFSSTINTAINELQNAFKPLEQRMQNAVGYNDVSARLRSALEIEQASVNSLIDYLQRDTSNVRSEDLDDMLPDVKAKTELYRAVATVLQQIDTQAEQNISVRRQKIQERSARVVSQDEWNAKRDELRHAAQDILTKLIFKTATLNAIAEYIDHIQVDKDKKAIDRELFEESIIQKLLSGKQHLLKQMGLVTENGVLVEEVSYQEVLGLLYLNIQEFLDMRKKIHTYANNARYNDLTDVAKKMVAFASEIIDAEACISTYKRSRDAILAPLKKDAPQNGYQKHFGLNDPQRIYARLQELELKKLEAHSILIAYDLSSKKEAFASFYEECFKSVAFETDPTVSTLKTLFVVGTMLSGGYLWTKFGEPKENLAAAWDWAKNTFKGFLPGGNENTPTT